MIAVQQLEAASRRFVSTILTNPAVPDAVFVVVSGRFAVLIVPVGRGAVRRVASGCAGALIVAVGLEALHLVDSDCVAVLVVAMATLLSLLWPLDVLLCLLLFLLLVCEECYL